MESKALFRTEDQGYCREDVEKYIDRLKAEYKKVFEYAKATEATNEKLKNFCRTLSDENKALKANGAAAAAAPASNAEAIESAEKISSLITALSREAEALKAKLN